MKRTLGRMEAQLLAYCQLRGLATLRTGDLTGPLRVTRKQERELLSRMARAGIIAKVKRGLYLVPPSLPLGGVWSPDFGLAINTLMEDRLAMYQVCGPNAFNYYGFDQQVPNRVYAYNDRLSGDTKIGSLELTLIKVATNRLGSTEEVRSASDMRVLYSSRVRTLVDAVYDWSRFDSLPRGYAWIRDELAAHRIEAAELANVAVRYGNQGTVRRIGALLEQDGADEGVLRTLEASLRLSKSVIAAVPGDPKRGPKNARWGVILNERR